MIDLLVMTELPPLNYIVTEEEFGLPLLAHTPDGHKMETVQVNMKFC